MTQQLNLQGQIETQDGELINDVYNSCYAGLNEFLQADELVVNLELIDNIYSFLRSCDIRLFQDGDRDDIKFVLADTHITYEQFLNNRFHPKLCGIAYLVDLIEQIFIEPSDEYLILYQSLHDEDGTRIADDYTTRLRSYHKILMSKGAFKATKQISILLANEQKRFQKELPIYANQPDYKAYMHSYEEYYIELLELFLGIVYYENEL